MITVKTISEITSCITFSWKSENGPPLIFEPIRLAGTMKQYSMKATPQEAKIIRIRGHFVVMFICWSLRFPYQANVIKQFEITSNNTVERPFIIIETILNFGLYFNA